MLIKSKMVESWTTTHYNGVTFISLDFSKHVIAIFLKRTFGFFCCTTGHLATRLSHVLSLPHVIQWPALVITTLKTRLDRALTRNEDVSINRRLRGLKKYWHRELFEWTVECCLLRNGWPSICISYSCVAFQRTCSYLHLNSLVT